jgi:hypothetical protein
VLIDIMGLMAIRSACATVMHHRPHPAHEVRVEVADLEIIDPGGLLNHLDALEPEPVASGGDQDISAWPAT